MKWKKKKLIYNMHVSSMGTKVAKEAVSDTKKSHYSTLTNDELRLSKCAWLIMTNKDGVGDMISGML